MISIFKKSKYRIIRYNKKQTKLFFAGMKHRSPVWTTNTSDAVVYSKKGIKFFKEQLKTKQNPLNIKIEKI